MFCVSCGANNCSKCGVLLSHPRHNQHNQPKCIQSCKVHPNYIERLLLVKLSLARSCLGTSSDCLRPPAPWSVCWHFGFLGLRFPWPSVSLALARSQCLELFLGLKLDRSLRFFPFLNSLSPMVLLDDSLVGVKRNTPHFAQLFAPQLIQNMAACGAGAQAVRVFPIYFRFVFPFRFSVLFAWFLFCLRGFFFICMVSFLFACFFFFGCSVSLVGHRR